MASLPKSLHVVPYIADESSGPAYSVPSLCKALRATGAHAAICTLNPTPTKDWNTPVYGYERKKFPAHAFGRSPDMKKALAELCEGADILHNHSMWMMPNIYPGIIPRPSACRLVLSPRGAMSEWALARSRWKKRISLILGQAKTLRSCDMFVASSDQEYQDIRDYGITAPVAVIPNGIDCPIERPKQINSESRTILFVSRLHPKKGVHLLIDAWSQVVEDFPQWTLAIAGPIDSPYSTRLRSEVEKAKIPRITFTGELGTSMRDELMHQASFTVFPTLSESFGMVVAESLAAGTPVLCSRGAPWSDLVTKRAGWWIEIGVQPLAEGLRRAMLMNDEDLLVMGRNGRKWMMKEYTWQSVARQTLESYAWIRGGGEKPDFVRI